MYIQLPNNNTTNNNYIPDSIVQTIIQKFKDRAKQGEEKYDGKNLDRSDYSLQQWLEEAIQEHMDAILYLQKALKTMKENNIDVYQ